MGNQPSSSSPAPLDDAAKQSLAEKSKFPRQEVDALWEEYRKKKDIKSPKELVQIFDKLHLLDELWDAMVSISQERAGADSGAKKAEVNEIIHKSLHDPTNNDLRNVLGDQLFRSFDVNADGHISFEELLCGLAAVLHGDREEHVKLLFRAMDRDKSGFIDKNELGMLWKFQAVGFRTGMVVGIHAKKAEMRRLGMRDSDFDGILKVVDDYLKDPKVQDVFVTCVLESADANKDGKISAEEYKTWYTSVEAQRVYQERLQKVLQPYVTKMSQKLAQELMSMVMRVVQRKK